MPVNSNDLLDTLFLFFLHRFLDEFYEIINLFAQQGFPLTIMFFIGLNGYRTHRDTLDLDRESIYYMSNL